MGRKRKSDEPRATPSRSSARLANKPKVEEPEKPKPTPKQKRTPRKKQVDKLNDSETTSNESPNKSLELEKGDASMEENEKQEDEINETEKHEDEPATKKSKLDETHSTESKLNSNPEEETPDFVLVKSSEVPAPESNEVKEAIKAQGEDAELLVNVVQVSKDEVPAADSEEVAKCVPPVGQVKHPESEPATNHGNENKSSEQENGNVLVDESPVVKDNGVPDPVDNSSPSKLSAVSAPDAAPNCTSDTA